MHNLVLRKISTTHEIDGFSTCPLVRIPFTIGIQQEHEHEREERERERERTNTKVIELENNMHDHHPLRPKKVI
jgi:hypothetical protein